MSSFRNKLLPVTDSSSLSANATTCPYVADLIEFVVGQSAKDLEEQIRYHLVADNCSSCRSWVDQANRYRDKPPIDWSKMSLTAIPLQSALPSSSDPTPVPENAKWQRQAFRDLERRLALLEQS
jgi:hypothetical protein